jgi:arylsulfatase A-like enzyme
MQLFGHTRAYLCCVRHIALVIGSVWLASVASAQQPNIVIINIDDMGWGDFGAYGSAYSQTPNIDQLATEGTRFTQFYTGAPICSPSRAALLTGQYAARSGDLESCAR